MPLLSSPGRKIGYYTIVHSFYALLAGGFEIALLLRLYGSFERITGFNLLFYTLLFVAFFAGTLLLRSGKASRSFRLDLLAIALGSGYMMLNFAHLGDAWVLAGFFVFRGTSEGLFWSTRHTALLHSVHDDERDRWALRLQSVTIVLSVALPVVSGFVISELALPAPAQTGPTPLPPGYFSIYALTAVLALGALAFSPELRIPAQVVRLRSVAAAWRVKGHRAYKGYLFSAAMVGSGLVTAVGILNFSVLKTEFSMGVLASVLALASAAFFAALGVARRRFRLSRLRMTLVGGAGEFASRLIFALFTSVPGLVAKSMLDSFVAPLRALFGENIVRRRVEVLAQEAGLSIAEAVLYQETLVYIGRLTIFVTFLVVLNVLRFDAVTVARGVLFLFLGYSFLDFWLLRALHRGHQRRAVSADPDSE